MPVEDDSLSSSCSRFRRPRNPPGSTPLALTSSLRTFTKPRKSPARTLSISNLNSSVIRKSSGRVVAWHREVPSLSRMVSWISGLLPQMPGPWMVKVGVGPGSEVPVGAGVAGDAAGVAVGACGVCRRSKAGVEMAGLACFSISAWICANASSIRSSLSESSSCPATGGAWVCSMSPEHPVADVSIRTANKAVIRKVKNLVPRCIAIQQYPLFGCELRLSESTGFSLMWAGYCPPISGHSEKTVLLPLP